MLTRLGDQRREKNLQKGVNRRPSLPHAVVDSARSHRGATIYSRNRLAYVLVLRSVTVVLY